MITPVTFTLDDATLSGGAAIVAAGGGLPRRITGQIDYEALVLSLNPTGYWPLSETTGNFLDRTANAKPMTVVGSRPATVAGHGRGGVIRNGIQMRNATGDLACGTTEAIHQMSAGSGFTAMIWMRCADSGASVGLHLGIGTQVYPGESGYQGWGLFWTTPVRQSFGIAQSGGAAQRYAAGAPDTRWREWTPFIGRYSGGGFGVAGSWSLFAGEASSLFVNLFGAGNPAPPSLPLQIGNPPSATYGVDLADAAIWQRALSDVEILSLMTAVPCGTARWELPVAAYDRTLRGLQFPGFTARIQDATGPRKGVRAFYNVGGGGDISCDPAQSLDEAIPAGATCEVGFDLVHHHIDDLPYVGDYQGVVEPTVLIEEPDPPRYFAALSPRMRVVPVGGTVIP